MGEKSIEILLIEDNAGDVRLTQEALKESKLIVNLNVVMVVRGANHVTALFGVE